jgi:hypothetical protein
MKLRKLLVATAVLAFSGLSAYADTLVMNNGREIRGKLVSINRGIILFNQENGRQIRVNVNRVDDINFGDDDTADRETDNNGRYSNDGRYSNTDRNNDQYGEQSVAVYADRTWTDTGMTVRAGDILRFVPSGEIVWGPSRRDGPTGEVNSPYNQGRPIPDRPGGALIGRIGNDTFYIGDGSTSFRARTSGRLFLGINDDYVQDNQGHFQVVVQRQNQY